MELLTDIIDIIIINKYCKAFLDIRTIMNRNAFCIVNILLAAGMFWINKLNIYSFNLFYSICCVFLISLNYEGNIRKKAYIILVYLAAGFVAETAGVFWLTGMQKENLVIVNEKATYLTALWICEAIKIAAALFIVKTFGKNGDYSGRVYSWLGAVFIVVIFGCVGLMHLAAGYSEAVLPEAVLLLAVVGITCFSIIISREIAVIMRKEKEQKAKLIDRECKEEFYETFQKRQLEMEKIRHNYKNQLLGIRGALEKNKDMGIKEIDSLLNAIQQTNKGLYTPNYILNTICNYKFHMAAEMGIAMEYNIRVPENIGIDAYSLSVLYGNLFDNAIEACMVLPEAQRIISFKTSYKKNELYIRMQNPYIEKEKAYLNRQQKHGMGLVSVKEIVDKYDGIYNVDKENGNYKVRICIYTNPGKICSNS